MSRTRIVQGKYIKISQGEHNMSAEGNIVSNALLEVREKGNDNGVIYGNFERKGSDVNEDFEITFSLRKDKEYSTVVPFGILDFKGKYENPHFVFGYSLTLSNVDSLEFKILTEDGTVLYAATNLPELVIPSKKIPLLAESIVKGTPMPDPLQPKKVLDLDRIFNPYNILPADYTKIGSYMIFWDGFDENDIYDSAKFDNKRFKAQIIAKKNGKEKIKEVEFSTKYSEVDWVDVKIDKKSKRIDTTLRVNLKDSGEEGLQCSTNLVGGRDETRWETNCPWDKIPKETLLNSKKEPIKKRTKSFADLEKLAIEGLNYHWGRNTNHAVAKDIKVANDSYEIYLNAINTENNSMDDVSLVYNTNNDWLRSGNPGTATGNPISWIGNAISREAICFNIGYIKYSNSWGYSYEHNEILEFKFTTAHEIGHEILKSYAGTSYSYGHKGSVSIITQNIKDISPNFPSAGEIDIMPYYPSDPPISLYDKYIAAEKDVLGLLWLTKLKIK